MWQTVRRKDSSSKVTERPIHTQHTGLQRFKPTPSPFKAEGWQRESKRLRSRDIDKRRGPSRNGWQKHQDYDAIIQRRAPRRRTIQRMKPSLISNTRKHHACFPLCFCCGSRGRSCAKFINKSMWQTVRRKDSSSKVTGRPIHTHTAHNSYGFCLRPTTAAESAVFNLEPVPVAWRCCAVLRKRICRESFPCFA